jgi:hypothetical protein
MRVAGLRDTDKFKFWSSSLIGLVSLQTTRKTDTFMYVLDFHLWFVEVATI